MKWGADREETLWRAEFARSQARALAAQDRQLREASAEDRWYLSRLAEYSRWTVEQTRDLRKPSTICPCLTLRAGRADFSEGWAEDRSDPIGYCLTPARPLQAENVADDRAGTAVASPCPVTIHGAGFQPPERPAP